MKHILSFLLLLLLSYNSYSQGTTKSIQQLVISNFINPNDPVEKFKGVLFAMGDSSKKSINVDTISNPGSYNLLIAVNDSFQLGDVKIKDAFVATGSNKKIVSVGFSKVYTKKVDLSYINYVHLQYFNLAEYMDTTLDVDHIADEKQTKVYKKDGKYVAPNITNGLTWKKDNITYRLFLEETPMSNYATDILATLTLKSWKNN